MNKKIVAAIAAIIITLICIFFIAALHLPYQGERTTKVAFQIKKGDSLSKISSNLKSEGIILSSSLFKLYSRILGKSRTFKVGYYSVKDKVSIYRLIEVFDQGKEQLIRITIPEGYRMSEIFSLLKSKDFDNEGNYNQLGKDIDFIASLNLPVPLTNLEGFLFPDTYFLSRQSSEKDIIRIMTQNFLSRIPKDYDSKAKKVGLDFYKAVSLASIIEKETGKGEERPVISSVFHNRLRKKMRLQTDPSVIYGIPNFDGNITSKQLRTKTAYNTYTNFGLPPTPIANPGLKSLMAAVNPDNTQYLYFVGMGNGKHKFSKTYREHNQAVTKYQRRRVKNYRSF